jgi:hypothetical protein
MPWTWRLRTDISKSSSGCTTVKLPGRGLHGKYHGNGLIEVVKWLHENQKILRTDEAMYMAAENGHIEVFCDCTRIIIKEAPGAHHQVLRSHHRSLFDKSFDKSLTIPAVLSPGKHIKASFDNISKHGKKSVHEDLMDLREPT